MEDSRYNIDSLISESSKSFVRANIKDLKDLSTNTYVVEDTDEFRLDLISYVLYGTVNLKWILLYVNNVLDISALKKGTKLKYPSIEDIVSMLMKVQASE